MRSFPNIDLSYKTRTYVNHESYLRRLHEHTAYQADWKYWVFYPPSLYAFLDTPDSSAYIWNISANINIRNYIMQDRN